MAWYTGKSIITVLSCGDSNCLGSGGVTPPGGQTTNAKLHCYASASGQVPYLESNLDWRAGLDPNGTLRAAEYASAQADPTPLTYTGQFLGSNGNSAMAMCDYVQQNTGEDPDVYLYQTGMGFALSSDWASGKGWDTLDRTVATALASVPTAPTAFDVIFFSMGGADLIDDVDPETYYANYSEWRGRMIAAGWWIPGTTQVIIMDAPWTLQYNGEIWPNTWGGYQYAMNRKRDCITSVTTRFAELDYLFLHPLPPYQTAIGIAAGEKLIEGIPVTQATISLGGTRLSLGGLKLRAHAA